MIGSDKAAQGEGVGEPSASLQFDCAPHKGSLQVTTFLILLMAACGGIGLVALIVHTWRKIKVGTLDALSLAAKTADSVQAVERVPETRPASP
jgi:hypothetical protein